MSHLGGDGDDSFNINVEPPKEHKAKMTSVIPTYELVNAFPEAYFIKLHFNVNRTYLNNLFDRKEEPNVSEEIKKKYGPYIIIYYEFEFVERVHNGLEMIDTTHKGSIAMKWEKYKGLTVLLDLGELQVQELDYKFARLVYKLEWEAKFTRKSYMMTPSIDHPNCFSFLIEDRDLDMYTKPSLAMELVVSQEPKREKEYKGIRNEGCTCYMNSTLQILFFIRPLRKIIVEYSGNNKIVLTLKTIFCELMDLAVSGSHMHAVDAYDLIKAYGRFDEFPLRQQDIHEFLLGFLDELETVCGQLKELWLAGSRQILTSVEKDKPY